MRLARGLRHALNEDHALHFHPRARASRAISPASCSRDSPRTAACSCRKPGRHFSPSDWRAMRGLSYPDLAARVMTPFVGGVDRVRDAGEDLPRRLRRLRPSGGRASGATRNASVRARTVPRPDARVQGHGDAGPRPLFDHVLSERDARVTIVGATSGDTGSAAIEACANRDRIDIVILHPHERISPVQRRQMTTVRRRTSATSRSRARSTIARTW